MNTEDQQEELFSQIGNDLADQGYAIVDHFLSAEVQALLRSELENLLTQGALKEAGIGNSGSKLVKRGIRGDQIYWLEEDLSSEESATPEGLTFLTKVHQVREFLRRFLMLPLRGVEAHYAVYPVGTFYKKHLDQFQGESHRKLSFICYLNENWQDGDGGELVIYPEGLPEVKIAPVGGRIVIFRSDLLEHEVSLTHARRVGITGWMLDCEPGLRFLNK